MLPRAGPRRLIRLRAGSAERDAVMVGICSLLPATKLGYVMCSQCWGLQLHLFCDVRPEDDKPLFVGSSLRLSFSSSTTVTTFAALDANHVNSSNANGYQCIRKTPR